MGEIRARIERYLKKNRFCVLCTGSGDRVRATPVRYWSDGMNIIIYSEKYTAKYKHLKKNSNVSLGILNKSRPLRGLQLWGTAEVLAYGDPRHEEHLPPQIKKNPRLIGARKMLHLIYITAQKIVFFEQGAQGSRFYQVSRNKRGSVTEKEMKTLRSASRL